MTEGKGQRGLERDSDVIRESCETDSEARRSPSVSFGAQAAGLVRTSVGVSVRSIELVGRARESCVVASAVWPNGRRRRDPRRPQLQVQLHARTSIDTSRESWSFSFLLMRIYLRNTAHRVYSKRDKHDTRDPSTVSHPIYTLTHHTLKTPRHTRTHNAHTAGITHTQLGSHTTI